MTQSEEWRAVVGYEGAYEVSDQGRVRSLTRQVYAGSGHNRTHSGRTLSLYAGDKYMKVRLKRNGTGSTKNVHQLVAQAFIGRCPVGLEVCHNNGQHHDNRVGNLRYDTHSSNQLDTVRLGGNPLACRTHCKNGHEYPANPPSRAGTRARRCIECERVCTARRVANGEFRKGAS